MSRNLRTSDRYPVFDPLLIHLKSETDLIGRILDISNGGLSFEFVQLWDQEKSLNTEAQPTINVLASGCRVLDDMACRVAYCQDITRYGAFPGSIPTFRCGIAFQNPTPEHERQIGSILESCVARACVSVA